MKKSCDVLIVGAGIVGLATARELLRRGVKSITVLEKERQPGLHASGCNSGVLHAGLYYSSDSLKAKFCARGAQALKTYAASHDIPVNVSGKVLVATQDAQVPEMEALFKRAMQNGIRVEKITPTRLAQIEPAARTTGWAIYSPDTAVIDPHRVVDTLREDLDKSGVEFSFAEPVVQIRTQDKELTTTKNDWSYGHLINAAGLFADRLAHQMGVGHSYRILPFRGRYQKLSTEFGTRIHGLIYPVPDARLPFLGVHITKSIKGEVWVGPTAEPAFGRENYGGAEGIVWKELPLLLANLLSMTVRNASGLASHIKEEMKKILPGGLLAAAQELVPTLQGSDFTKETKTGLRAQLVDIHKMKLVMDFVVEKGPHSTHILNAVSPGFTASFAFAEYVADQVEQ